MLYGIKFDGGDIDKWVCVENANQISEDTYTNFSHENGYKRLLEE